MLVPRFRSDIGCPRGVLNVCLEVPGVPTAQTARIRLSARNGLRHVQSQGESMWARTRCQVAPIDEALVAPTYPELVPRGRRLRCSVPSYVPRYAAPGPSAVTVSTLFSGIQPIFRRDRMSVVGVYCSGISIGRPASEAGGRAFESRPGHHSFQALTALRTFICVCLVARWCPIF